MSKQEESIIHIDLTDAEVSESNNEDFASNRADIHTSSFLQGQNNDTIGDVPIPQIEVDQRSLLSYPKSKVSTLMSVRHRNAHVVPNPRLRSYLYNILLAIFMLIVGLGFLIAAIIDLLLVKGIAAGIFFLILGILIAPAGGYHLFYIYNAFKGTPGYQFSGIPSFD